MKIEEVDQDFVGIYANHQIFQCCMMIYIKLKDKISILKNE